MSERLAWELHTSRADAAIAMAITRRRPIPKGMDIDDAPALDHADLPYMDAYWQLHTCRAFGMSAGPIPWRDIVAFAMHRNYDPERTDALVTVVRAMDDVFLDYQEQRSKEAEKGGAAPKPEAPAPKGTRTGGRR